MRRSIRTRNRAAERERRAARVARQLPHLRATGSRVPRPASAGRRPRRRNAAKSPRTCFAACASTPTTASRPIVPGWKATSRPPARPTVSTGASCNTCSTRPPAPGAALGGEVSGPSVRAGCDPRVYPDARLVFVHRDPVKVLLSVARLTEVVRRPFTRRVNRWKSDDRRGPALEEGTPHDRGGGWQGCPSRSATCITLTWCRTRSTPWSRSTGISA